MAPPTFRNGDPRPWSGLQPPRCAPPALGAARGEGAVGTNKLLAWMRKRQPTGDTEAKLRKLLAKAELYPACRVIVCDEAYTSKTCGQCGAINRKLGGSKVFRCKPCGYTADRDASAARNILLRYLTLHGVRL